MNEDELTMLSEEDGREEISASELMRPAAGGNAAEKAGAAQWGGSLEEAQADAGEADADGQEGDEADDGEPGDGKPDGKGEEQDAALAAVGRYRDALTRLMDDGWTIDELKAMCTDDGVRRALEQGETLGRAATAYMRRGVQARKPAKRGVPTFRAAATEDMWEDDPIARMTDAEFAAFSRRAKEAALAGKRIRLG